MDEYARRANRLVDLTAPSGGMGPASNKLSRIAGVGAVLRCDLSLFAYCLSLRNHPIYLAVVGAGELVGNSQRSGELSTNPQPTGGQRAANAHTVPGS